MDKRIESIERDVDGWWIYLKPGFVMCDDLVHQIHDDTKRAALSQMAMVEPCDCDECKQIMGVR